MSNLAIEYDAVYDRKEILDKEIRGIIEALTNHYISIVREYENFYISPNTELFCDYLQHLDINDFDIYIEEEFISIYYEENRREPERYWLKLPLSLIDSELTESESKAMLRLHLDRVYKEARKKKEKEVAKKIEDTERKESERKKAAIESAKELLREEGLL